jgi:putative nucleotidyltransferase with HDIG domain
MAVVHLCTRTARNRLMNRMPDTQAAILLQLKTHWEYHRSLGNIQQPLLRVTQSEVLDCRGDDRSSGLCEKRIVPIRVKALVCIVVAGALASVSVSRGHPGQQWIHFSVYLTVILLSSGMKVAMPKSEGTMSVNFPFIFLGILQLSPEQAVCLAVCSVIAQCRFRVVQTFTVVQILFNVANVTTATALAWWTFSVAIRAHTQSAPAMALAATIYFLANTVPLALVLGWVSDNSPFTQWRQEFLWYLPFYLVGAMLAVLADFIGVHFGWLTSLLLIPMVYTIYRAYCAQMAIMRAREQHIREVEALHMRTIEGLSMAIEAKDEGTHDHLMRVRVYVEELGRIMNLDPPLLRALHTAAFLHDIGKLAVPEYIINKPGKLTPEEFEKMKIHPAVGADILERVKFPYPVVPIVRSHHEAWNGSGYPDGLKGEEIPIGARILTVVDCFDALASDRPYRKAMSLQEAMVLLKSKAGIQFDPAIVELLEAHYEDLEKLACQRSSEMQPLKTDLLIERGAAPGAGFEAIPVNVGRRPDAAATTGPVTNAGHLSPGEVDAAIRELIAAFQHLGRRNSSDIRDLCSILSLRLRALIAFDCFAVFHHRDDSAVLLFKNGPCATAFSDAPLAAGTSLSCWVIESGRPIVNGNPTVETSLLADGPFTANSSAMSIPLVDAGGSIFGALTLYSRDRAAFSSEHLQILQAVQPEFTPALQRAVSGAAKSLIETDELDAEPGAPLLAGLSTA